MALMTWNDGFSVKIRDIDGQHKKLLDMINGLHDDMKAGKSKESLSKTIAGLKNYAASHFATEEKYFKQHSYPGAAAHIAEHQKFVQKVLDFERDFNAGKALLTMGVLVFLKDWYNGHVTGVDKLYGPYLNEKGVH